MLQHIRKAIHLRTIFKMLPSMLFLCFILFVMARSTSSPVASYAAGTELSISSLFSFADGFENVLQNNICGRTDFIDLNGLYIRLTGQNSLNRRQKLKNGALTTFAVPYSAEVISRSADEVIALDRFLKQEDIPFLYLLAPNKHTVYDVAFAPGYGEPCESDIHNMIRFTSEAGVETIDMNAWFARNTWSSDDLFFKTDHHWKPEAALESAKVTMEYLEQQGICAYNRELFSSDAWTVEVWEDHFLGSEGKRVGVPFAGVDDISIYMPNFPTDYSYARLVKDETTWVYGDRILDESYRGKIRYHQDSPYYAYMFADSPLRVTRNSFGWNDHRLLIIGDSYKLPYEYFLSAQFKEIYTMDLRYYTDGSLVQAVEEIQPEIIIMCNNAPNNEQLHEFGVEEHRAALEKAENRTPEITELHDITLEAQPGNYNHFTVVCGGLESGETYTITAEDTEIQGGENRFVQMTLQNLTTNEPVYNHYFEASREEAQKWIFTVPDETTDAFAIYVYAGTKGYTADIAAALRNVKLYDGIPQDA